MTREQEANKETTTLTKTETSYFPESDLLHIKVGSKTSGTSYPVTEGVYVRRSTKTERIASVIIERYSRRDKKQLLELLPSVIKNEDLPSQISPRT